MVPLLLLYDYTVCTLIFSVNECTLDMMLRYWSSNSGLRDYLNCDSSSLEPKIILFVNLR